VRALRVVIDQLLRAADRAADASVEVGGDLRQPRRQFGVPADLDLGPLDEVPQQKTRD
jgi:hypothetical protein